MAAVKISAFGGIAPKLNPRYLPEQRAQTAQNVDTTRAGALTPLRDYGAPILTGITNAKALYRYNEDYATEDGNWWIASKNDTDFCRSQIIGDAVELTYFTDNDNAGLPPQFFYDQNVSITDTTTGLYLSTYYGINDSYDLGVNAPAAAPSVSIINPAADTDGLSREFRTYVFTYVWKFAGREMESGPSPAADAIGLWLASTESVQVDTLTTSPPSAQMASGDVYKRVYRAVGGSYFFLTEIPVTQQVFNDNVDPDDLSEELPSLTWSPPPADLQGMVNMANGMMAGFVGRDVYLCEPYIPHAWPGKYAVSVESPVVALAAIDTTLVVLTEDKPYFLQGSSPDFITVVEGDINQGCKSKRSVAVLNGKVYYVSPDGLMAVSPNGSQIVTEQLFSYRQWADSFNLPTVHGYTHNLKYFGFHDGGCFIYDLPTGEFTTSDLTASAALPDTRLDKLYVTQADGAVEAWGDGANTTATWVSKKFGFPGEISFTTAQIEAEAYPVGVKFFTENGLLYNHPAVPDREMFRLPVIRARDWWVEVTTDQEVFNVAMAQAGDEISGV